MPSWFITAIVTLNHCADGHQFIFAIHTLNLALGALFDIIRTRQKPGVHKPCLPKGPDQSFKKKTEKKKKQALKISMDAVFVFKDINDLFHKVFILTWVIIN